jgi:hypothetical protein
VVDGLGLWNITPVPLKRVFPHMLRNERVGSGRRGVHLRWVLLVEVGRLSEKERAGAEPFELDIHALREVRACMHASIRLFWGLGPVSAGVVWERRPIRAGKVIC